MQNQQSDLDLDMSDDVFQDITVGVLPWIAVVRQLRDFIDASLALGLDVTHLEGTYTLARHLARFLEGRVRVVNQRISDRSYRSR